MNWLEGTVGNPRQKTINHKRLKRKKRRLQMRRAVEKARRKGTGTGRAQRAVRLKWRMEDRRRRNH